MQRGLRWAAAVLGSAVAAGLAGCGSNTVASSVVPPVQAGNGAAKDVYVLQQPGGGSSGMILEFGAASNGGSSPILSLTPTLAASSLFVDTTGQIYAGGAPGGAVVNTGAIQVYAPGTSGSVSLVRTVNGTASVGNFISAIATWVDSGGLLYVLGTNGSLSVYATGAATPYRFIQGTATGLTAPTGLVVDGLGNIFVANNDPVTPSILVFSATQSGNVAPVRTITSSLGALSGLAGIGLDTAGDVYVTNGTAGGAASSIVVFAPSAFGLTTPLRTIAGPSTGLAYAAAVSVDGAGNTYVLNDTTTAGVTTPGMLVFAPGASGNASPATQFTSASWTTAVGQIGLY